MSVLRQIAIAAVVVASAAPAAAQSHALAGAWTVEYQRGLTNENGEISPIMGTGRLELAQRGDSLVGTLTQVGAPAGPDAPKPLQLAGVANGTGSATLVSTSTVRVEMNGDEQILKVTMTWRLTADGDALTGTLARVAEGHDMPDEPSPVKGTRVK